VTLIHHWAEVNRLAHPRRFHRLPMCDKDPYDSAEQRQSICGKVSLY